jgi:hypothetical protein
MAPCRPVTGATRDPSFKSIWPSHGRKQDSVKIPTPVSLGFSFAGWFVFPVVANPAHGAIIQKIQATMTIFDLEFRFLEMKGLAGAGKRSKLVCSFGTAIPRLVIFPASAVRAGSDRNSEVEDHGLKYPLTEVEQERRISTLDSSPVARLSRPVWRAPRFGSFPAVEFIHDATSIEPSDDSVYGHQAGVAAAGTNLAAGGGHLSAPDPNADLGQASPPPASCEGMPAAYTTFSAHSSPLGFTYFGPTNPLLHDTFLVALHGASHPHIGTGYRVVRFTATDRAPKDFLTGFLTRVQGRPVVHGRPCGLLQIGLDKIPTQ